MPYPILEKHVSPTRQNFPSFLEAFLPNCIIMRLGRYHDKKFAEMRVENPRDSREGRGRKGGLGFGSTYRPFYDSTRVNSDVVLLRPLTGGSQLPSAMNMAPKTVRRRG